MRPWLIYCGDLCNLGDLALLLQNLEHRPAGRRAYVRRWAPLPAEIAVQVTAAGGELVDGRRLLTFLWRAWRCDVVIGGGQLVRDNVSLASLVAQYAGALAARLGGGAVTTRGLGVSAIGDPRRRRLWRALLRLAPVVRVRDPGSAGNAAMLVGAERVVLTADMAFVPGALHAALAGGGGRRNRIIVAPCIDGSEGRSMSAELLRHILSAAGDGELVFACHDPRPGMDGAAARALMMPGARIVEGWSLPALLAEYRRASLVVTNRLHAIIFALLADSPILVIDDGTAKTRFIAERFGLPVVANQAVGRVAGVVTRAFVQDPSLRRDELDALARVAMGNL